MDTVENGAFAAARIAENAEQAAVQQLGKIYFRFFRKAVDAAKFEIYGPHARPPFVFYYLIYIYFFPSGDTRRAIFSLLAK